jgi:hypothetical protein
VFEFGNKTKRITKKRAGILSEERLKSSWWRRVARKKRITERNGRSF